MTPIQQLMLGVGASKKTYLDDVFSTYLYTGDLASSRSITNNINLSGEGGLVWVKDREGSGSENHILTDTIRGANKQIYSNGDYIEGTDTGMITGFSATGFTVGNSSHTNEIDEDFASWTFRKAPGFFDVVTYTGNGTAGKTVNHSLGCIPGLIMVKKTSEAGGDWYVYHKSIGVTQAGILNSNGSFFSSSSLLNNTEPTSTQFTLGNSEHTNDDGEDFVAYLFAGGESTAATARSVEFDGSQGHYLQVQSTSSDLEMGSSDFTLEMWINSDGVTTGNRTFFSLGNPVQMQHNVTGNKIGFFFKDDGSNWFINNVTSPSIADGTWNHIAITRSGNTWRFFLNGSQFYTGTHNVTVMGLGTAYPSIGSYNSGSNAYGFDGKISNLRFVKGTAVYTSSFRPPTEPLTNITNTKLLCCNNSSITGSTVSPGTLAQNGNTAITDSPFDDPAGFVFGNAGDQNVVKMGSYIGNGSTTGPEVYLGWEPQWIVLKNADESEQWLMFDSMRGIATDGYDQRLFPSTNDQESSTANYLDLTSTGFKLKDNSTGFNGDGDTIIYIAIRRPDGYVGKPIETGTDAFAMDTGAGGTTIPNYDSGFPVDMAIDKIFDDDAQWYLSGRLTGTKYLRPDENSSITSHATYTWDSNVGWGNGSWQSSIYQSWMFRRHAGFDVLNYVGNSVTGRAIPHSLSKTPEMIWVKNWTGENWAVYHKGLNGGTNPHEKEVWINSGNDEMDTDVWNDTAPTSTHFSLDNNGRVNETSANYTAILFASVPGVSKIGSYTGNGSSSGVTITTGFQPRFYIVKRTDASASPWYVVDSLRGMSNSGDEKGLQLENSQGQFDHNFGNTSSTGFTITSTDSTLNADGGKYIYYAHA